MDQQSAATQTAPLQAGPPPSRFSDVCGTIDALKQVLHEDPAAAAASPAALSALLDDALVMEERMEQRLREYEAFREQIVAIAAALQELGASRRQNAVAAAAQLRSYLQQGRVLTEEERAAAVEQAEAVRAVAQGLENTLYRYKDLALDLARAYRAVQGTRSWVLDEAEARGDGVPLPGEPRWARWLPPSPHRERILRYLRVGRAHLVPVATSAADAQSEEPPLVQFEDGGLMPLPVVRWSEEVRNFYPVDSPPHPHGLRYRD